MKIVTSAGVPVGNYYDKYTTRNPVARWLVDRFLRDVLELASQSSPSSIHEIGCGEGELTHRLARMCACPVRGSDFSPEIVAEASRRNVGLPVTFEVRSIYDLQEGDGADLVVCCEVLEHLENPELALEILCRLPFRYMLLSVPREPLWRFMNMARGKYLGQLGNTPGHLQHWSSSGFSKMLRRHLQIVEIRQPLPWTIALCCKR